MKSSDSGYVHTRRVCIYCRVREHHRALTLSYDFNIFSFLSQELVEEYFDAQQAGPGRGGA